MLRALTIAALLALSPTLASAQSLKGVWSGVAQVTINGPNDVQLIEFNAPRYLIYTDAYFSYTFMPEGQRPTGELSDAQMAEVARNYVAVAGTYLRDGATIRYNRRATLNPNGSLAANQPQVREIRVLTANRLVTQVTNPDGVTVALIYDRIE
jgi:predicted amidohydrolase